jgi:hypothetical protein
MIRDHQAGTDAPGKGRTTEWIRCKRESRLGHRYLGLSNILKYLKFLCLLIQKSIKISNISICWKGQDNDARLWILVSSESTEWIFLYPVHYYSTDDLESYSAQICHIVLGNVDDYLHFTCMWAVSGSDTQAIS